ncbi:MAG TPA: hypothetical protein VJL82_11535 [Rhizomicrobium sp.]|nr:hypothetical protein [Rhizomicrobium sp.]
MTVAATAVAVFFGSVAAKAQERSVSNVPYFPLRADASVVAEQASLQNGAVLYQQVLHPVAGIRITAPVALHHAAGALMGGNLNITVPAGTVFLSTIFEKNLYFCSAQALQNSFLWGVVEVGVCLRDSDGNGVADQQVVLKNDLGRIGAERLRNIFELFGEQKDVPVTPVSITYEKIPAQSLPALDLKMSVGPSGGLFRRSRGVVVLQICVPPEISTVPKDGVRCAYIDWKETDVVDTISGTIANGTVQFDKDVAEVKWGPVTLLLQRQAGEMVSVKNTRVLPSGVMGLIGTGTLEDTGQGVAVVSFMSLPPVPALAEIGEIR